MGKTYRNIPIKSSGFRFSRKPHNKGKKVFKVEPQKTIVDDWSDKPVAAIKEIDYHSQKLGWWFNRNK